MSFLKSRQWQRFKSIKRGYWSAVLLSLFILLSCFAELLINNRALIVKYEGSYYLPTYGKIIPGKTFGLDYQYETNYKELKQQWLESQSNNWLIMPAIPFGPNETDLSTESYPPYAPSITSKHYLGTDTLGRDIVARIVYGFRIAIFFSLILLGFNYIVGVILGSLMGYLGGYFDLFFQRIIEIWSNIPFLYIVMILASIVIPSFWTLVLIMAIFGWTGITWFIRTATYKEASRDYIKAAQVLGASKSRIMFMHILPNTVYVIVTFVPFAVASNITALTALDYLGFGLPPPTPSWGELLKQGTDNLNHQWIAGSVIIAMTVVLTMTTFIGEAIRESLDPKKHSYYK